MDDHDIPAEELQAIEFSPVIPIPRQFDVNKRLQQLKSLLNNRKPPKSKQHPDYRFLHSENIKALIELYENGEIQGGQEVCLIAGRRVSSEEALKSTDAVWIENTPSQYALKQLYGHGGLGPPYHETPDLGAKAV